MATAGRTRVSQDWPGSRCSFGTARRRSSSATAATNASGNYSLIAPTPGDYRVRFVLPSAGDQFSPKDNAAAGDTLDSDVNPSGIDLGFTDIYTFASNLISITSIDAGLSNVSPTRTPTATATRTQTPIPTSTPTPLSAPGQILYLPLIRR